MGNNIKYSIIIPVYNAEKSLQELCQRIKDIFDNKVKEDFEVILVNDASKDKSWQIMKELHQQDSRIKVINLAKNSGQHCAMMCGLNNFSGDFVILMDDDLQHPPEDIPKLINTMNANPNIDVVIGTFLNKKHSKIRNIGSTAMKVIGRKLYNTDGKFRFTNFRIIRGNIARSIAEIHVDRPRVGQLILQTTRNIASVPVQHNERKFGKSGHSFFRLVKDFFLNIIYNSSLPLRLISYMGLFISMMSFLLAIFFVFRYFAFGTSVKGWTSLIVLTSLFSGFILFSLGIIGEYLIRILSESKKLPNFIEREKHF